MKLTLGFSPCPNDTFIFDAMVHNRIDTEGLTFHLVMEDVEALNHRALRQELAVTKLSYHAFAHLVDDYALLEAGSALGNGVGPLLIAQKPMFQEVVNQSLIAIPGQYTTANFLFSLAYPEAKYKKEIVFHDIEKAILRGEVDAGVIIHENRFTYQNHGLVKLIDLGEFWEMTTAMPIPLGGIVVRRDLPIDIQQKMERVMHRSVQFAFENPDASAAFVAEHAQEMDVEVRQKHIELYVNHFTEGLGEQGRAAVKTLFELAKDRGVIPNYSSEIFLNE
ncbi:MAG: 1,4-dihydroxy-6-naphthoate synthase [Saprospiraceae bacterium]|nr:1,4-dihydroxy-6-naphthoate synthase [Saprospiraceae bacterium]